MMVGKRIKFLLLAWVLGVAVLFAVGLWLPESGRDCFVAPLLAMTAEAASQSGEGLPSGEAAGAPLLAMTAEAASQSGEGLPSGEAAGAPLLAMTAEAASQSNETIPIKAEAVEEEDPVLRFYCERAAGQTRSRDPQIAGVSYARTVRAYMARLARGGKREVTDSAVYTDYISYGQVDSQVVARTTSEKLTKVDLGYPNVFAADYEFRFYPNDTGGVSLAIGFESDTVKNLSPVGLAVIDRTHYFLRKLYLYYPGVDQFDRYSREISFQVRNGYIFPDTVVTMFAQSGIFSTDHFRIESYIDSIHIFTPGAASRDTL